MIHPSSLHLNWCLEGKLSFRSDASTIEAVDDVFAECNEDIVNKMEAARKSTLELNIVAAQEKQKEIYMHCTNPAVYSVGALVLRKDFTRKKKEENSTVDGLILSS